MADGLARDTTIRVADAAAFQVGQDVLIDWTITQEFVDEHESDEQAFDRNPLHGFATSFAAFKLSDESGRRSRAASENQRQPGAGRDKARAPAPI